MRVQQDIMFRSLYTTILVLWASFLTAQIESNGTSTTWNTGSGWDGGSAPDPTFWDGSNDANVSHDKTYTGNMTFTNNNTIRIKSGATLTITGNLIIGNNGDLIIEPGGTISVGGSVSYTSNGSFVSDGTLTVTSNISVSNGGTLDIGGTTTVGGYVNVTGSGSSFDVTAGTLDVTGNVTLDGNGTYGFAGATTIGGNLDMDGASTVANVTGTLSITGQLDVQSNAYVQGTGYVDWGTAYVYGPGASYVKCNDGTKKDTEGTYNSLTGSSIDLTSCEECPSLSAGSISAAQTICYNETPSGLTSTADASGGNSSYSYQWESSTDNSTWSDVSGATSSTYSPGALTTSTYYRRKVTSCSGSQSGTTSSILITVYGDLTSGTIGSAQSICYNTTPASLTNDAAPTGGTGSYTYQWQSSSDNSTWSNISGATSTTYSPGALTASTYYRRAATSGSCGTEYTSSILVTVYSDLSNGTIGSAQTICYNTTPSSLTNDASPTGGTGSYTYQWQSSSDNSTWSDIGGATSATYAPGALTANTYYRRAETSGSCGTVYASSILITVYGDLSAGVIGTDQVVSYNGTPTSLTEETAASGGTGSYTYQWQSSTDGSSFSNISGATSATYSPGALTVNTWYRRAVTSGSCGTVYTASVAMTINVRVCNGSAPPAIAESTAPSGGTGSFTYQWQSSTDGTTFSDISGATSSTYTPGSVSQTTWYRRGVSSGSCGPIYTDAIKATVGAAPGGVESSLLVWLKADEGVDNIGTQWEDQSGAGNHYTTVSGPTVVTSDENFRPAVEITSGGFDAPAGATLSSSWTIFAVSKLLSSDNNGRVFDGASTDVTFGYSGGYRNSIYVDGTADNKTSGIASTSGIEDIHLFTYVRNNSTGNIEARTDGASLNTFTSTNSASGVKIDINQGSKSASESSDSRVFEFIIYNTNLSSSEVQKIESYLAIKYGITMDDSDGGTAGDYTSMDGTTFWDASASTAHANQVIGIGNNCGIVQKQSSTDDDSLRVFVGSLAASNSANAGTITNDDSYIVIGHDGGRLSATSTSNAEKPSGITSRLEREWKIKNTNFSDNYSIEIEWDSAGSVDLSHMRLLVDDDGDFSNASIYGSGDGLTFAFGSIIIGNIGTSFIGSGTTKFFTLGSSSTLTTLPVELTSFEAETHNDIVILNWETATEINNDYFEVHKSTDGINWDFIGFVLGSGNSTESVRYEFYDTDGCNASCYYRLKQVDYDGTEDFSKVVHVQGQNEELAIYKVFPNPVTNVLNVQLSSLDTQPYDLKIFTSDGKEIYNAHLVCGVGVNEFSIRTDKFPAGLYMLVINNPNGEKSKRISFSKL